MTKSKQGWTLELFVKAVADVNVLAVKNAATL